MTKSLVVATAPSVATLVLLVSRRSLVGRGRLCSCLDPCQHCRDRHMSREPGFHQRVWSPHSPDVCEHRTAPCSIAMQVAMPRQWHAAVHYSGLMCEGGWQGLLEGGIEQPGTPWASVV